MSLLLLFTGEGTAITITNPDPDNFAYVRGREKRATIAARNKRATIAVRNKRAFVER